MEGYSTLDLIFVGFMFFGGFGMFIYGMNIMADGLQKSAGNKMKSLLAMLTNNRVLGVLVGAGVTAIIQSSSATTVMVVGFVNAGLLNLTQAVGVIMGANIGTTITAWIVSSSEWLAVLKPSEIAPLAIGIGSMVLFMAKSTKKKQVAEIVIGFGLLFVGLEMMSDSISPFRELPAFYEAFRVLGKNPLFGILAGAIVTAVIQSSSASVGILQMLAIQKMVPWNAAVYIILGQNIGTCITAMLASIGANKTAKRAAVIHLMFNVIGTVIFAVGCIVFFKYINIALGKTLVNSVQISIFHSVFNIANTLMLFGFADKLVELSKRIVVGEDILDESESAVALRHLDERILETPGFAVENAVKEVVHMGELAIKNTKLSVEAILNKDLDKVELVLKNEKDINKLNKLITEYLVKISNTSLNEHQHIIITNLFYSINDIERIGDHAENIGELAKYYIDNNLTMSDTAHEEIIVISDKTIETVELAVEARRSDNADLIKKVEANEEEVDTLEEDLREKHIKRLASNKCDTTTGVVFLDILSNLERISDHALNIAYYVKDEAY